MMTMVDMKTIDDKLLSEENTVTINLVGMRVTITPHYYEGLMTSYTEEQRHYDGEMINRRTLTEGVYTPDMYKETISYWRKKI